MLQSLLGILFPKLCTGCNRSLLKNESFLCTGCRLHLPVTDYHLQPGNPLEKSLWGRVTFRRAYAFLFFRKGNITQRLLHSLKYRNNPLLGTFIGELYGTALKKQIGDIDAVVAVPLHESKLKKRGYNQSSFFAEGLSRTLKAKNMSGFMLRTAATETQTRKGRFERWKNVESIFTLPDQEIFKNKHVLIVDDVITTGATIEACAQVLQKVENCSISVASIAITAY